MITGFSGLGKKVIYKHFKNKENIAIAVLDELFKHNLERFNEIMKQDIPFEEKMKLHLEMKLKATKEYSREFIKELIVDKESEVGKYLQNKILEVMVTARQIYIDAQKKGDIRPDFKIEFIMYMLDRLVNITGEIMENEELQNRLFSDTSDMTEDLFNMFFYGIINRDKKQ